MSGLRQLPSADPVCLLRIPAAAGGPRGLRRAVWIEGTLCGKGAVELGAIHRSVISLSLIGRFGIFRQADVIGENTE